MVNHPNRSRKGKYEVFSAALGKFTATNNAKSERAASRDYRTFDTRAEAQAWADKMNAAQS